MIVYSQSSIQAINLIRREIKWTIPLKNVSKLHINYPVIVVFGLDRSLTGYDFFSGFQLWRKSTNYSGLYGSNVDLWMVSNKQIHKLDVVTAEVIQSITLDKTVNNILGDELFLYLQMGQDLYHYNLLNKTMFKVGDQFKVINKASNLILVGNKNKKELRTLSNDIITENVQHQMFKIHTPTNVMFSYLSQNKLSFMTKKGITSYEFTPSQNKGNIKYGYKLNDKIRVFYDDGQDVWTLKRIKKKESDLGI